MQGHVGVLAQDRDVFGLDVVGLGGASGTGDTDSLRQGDPGKAKVVVAEALSAGATFDIDDADAARAIQGVSSRRLSFIGNHQLGAGLIEGDPIGQIANQNIGNLGESGVDANAIEAHQALAAAGVVVGRRQGHSQKVAVAGYGCGDVAAAIGHSVQQDRGRRGGGISHLQGAAAAT